MINQDKLYQLLPAIYRQQDITQNQPLRALLAIMEHELNTLKTDVDDAYANCFIETCEAWVIPYLADLLGIEGFDNALRLNLEQRARVANTIRYRRRKGQAAIIERVINECYGLAR